MESEEADGVTGEGLGTRWGWYSDGVRGEGLGTRGAAATMESEVSG